MSIDEFLTRLAESIGVDREQLAPNQRLADLEEWDSMGVLEFQALSDEALDLRVDPTRIAACESVGDLCRLIAGRLDGERSQEKQCDG